MSKSSGNYFITKSLSLSLPQFPNLIVQMQQMGKDDLKQLIAQARLNEAVDRLLEQIKAHSVVSNSDKPIGKLSDILIINSGKLHGLQHDKMLGILDRQNELITEAQVQQAILYVIDELPDEFWNVPRERQTTKQNSGNEQTELLEAVESLKQVQPSEFEYDLFVSFSSLDREVLQPVVEKLRGYGLSVFISDQNLKDYAGISFSDTIEHSLEYSQHFVLVSSPNSAKSGWVKYEYKTFFDQFHVHDQINRHIFVLRGIGFDLKFVPLFLRNMQIADNAEQIVNTLVSESRAQEKLKIKNEELRIKERKIQEAAEEAEEERLGNEKHDKLLLEQWLLETQITEQDRLEQQKLLEEQAEQYRLVEKKAEEERIETVKQAKFLAELQLIEKQQKAEQDRLEKQKLAEESAEQKRLEAQKAEEERIENERKAKLITDQQLKEKQQKAEQDRLEQHKLQEDLAEQQRLAAQKAEEDRLKQQKLQEEKAEQERLAAQKAEEERIDNEKLAKLLAEQKLKEKQQKEELVRIEQQKLEEEIAEQQRLAAHKAEEERIENEKQAKFLAKKLLKEKQEQDRLEQQKLQEEQAKQQRLAAQKDEEEESIPVLKQQPMSAETHRSLQDPAASETINPNRKKLIYLLAPLVLIALVVSIVYFSTKPPEPIKKTEIKQPENNVVEINSLSPPMVLVKGGEFMMGDDNSTEKDEKPAHKVIVSDFYIGKYEVTQKQWTDIMGTNPSNFKGCDNCPVEQVSWNDVQDFIKKLNQKPGKTYRLPTEAEWEFACRAGTTTPFNTGNNLTTSQANYNGNYPYNSNPKGIYREKTMPVGSFAPNTLGLYDMHGNVWEWCSDWYDGKYYANSPQNNPKGPSTGSHRVIRGGSWYNYAQYCRSAIRNGRTPDSRDADLGFRLALVP